MLHLPPEIMRAVLKLIDRPSVLRLRLTCAAYRKMLPLEPLLPGLSATNVGWLVKGINVLWDERLDGPDVSVDFRDLPLRVYVGKQDVMRSVSRYNCCSLIQGNTLYDVSMSTGRLAIYTAETDESVFDLRRNVKYPRTDDPILCCCAMGENMIFVMTRAAGIFVVRLQNTAAETVDEFTRVLTGEPRLKLEKPYDANVFRAGVEWCAALGAGVWMLTHSRLLMLCDAKECKPMDRGVLSCQVVDDSVFYLKDEGVWIYHRNAFKTRTKITTDPVAAFAVTPELQCLWLVTVEGNLIRRGAPFLLPAGDAEEEAGPSKAMLGAKLVLAERRLERAVVLK